MTAKTDLIPGTKYSYPSNRNYFDEATSTATNGVIFDATKRGADYGIVDPEVAIVKPLYAPAV
tara:strand:- start:621 stop:809 length:189 start_codon:yes stop_codon:yes gene_type:complete